MKTTRKENIIDKINIKTSVVLSLLFLLLFYTCNKRENNQSVKSAMFMNNNQHAGKYNSQSVKEEPSILWKIKTEGPVISSPVIIDDMVYIGSGDNNLYAINATSGITKWVYKTQGPIHSTPLVAKGKVLFLSYDGFFYALNLSDGKLIWKFKTEGESKFKVKSYYNANFAPDFWDFYLSSAIASNDLVYFGSSDTNIYALDIESGEKVWNYKTGGNIHSSPAIYENSLVVGSWDSKIYCLNASTGTENWSYTTGRDTKYYVWLGIQASPSVGNGIVYVGSRDAKFYAFNIATGDTLWTNDQFNKSWMPSSAAIGNENIFTGSSDSDRFFSINKKTGIINYSVSTNSLCFSSPAIDNEMAYIGAGNGRLYGIDINNGDIKWEFQTIASKTDTIGMYSSDGKLDKEREAELSANVQDMHTYASLYEDIFTSIGSILSSPVISNQVIYFGSYDGYIYAITDKQ